MQAAVRIINHAGAQFVELPDVSFEGREILVRVLPTDNPAKVAVQCMNELKGLKQSPIITPKFS